MGALLNCGQTTPSGKPWKPRWRFFKREETHSKWKTMEKRFGGQILKTLNMDPMSRHTMRNRSTRMSLPPAWVFLEKPATVPKLHGEHQCVARPTGSPELGPKIKKCCLFFWSRFQDPKKVPSQRHQLKRHPEKSRENREGQAGSLVGAVATSLAPCHGWQQVRRLLVPRPFKRSHPHTPSPSRFRACQKVPFGLPQKRPEGVRFDMYPCPDVIVESSGPCWKTGLRPSRIPCLANFPEFDQIRRTHTLWLRGSAFQREATRHQPVLSGPYCTHSDMHCNLEAALK